MTNGVKVALIVGVFFLLLGPLGGFVLSHAFEVQAREYVATSAREVDLEVFGTYLWAALVAGAVGYLIGLSGLVVLVVALVLHLRNRKKAPAAPLPTS